MTRRKGILLAFLSLILAGLGFTLYIGHELAAPVPSAIGSPPSDLGAEAIEIPSRSGSRIQGWLCRIPSARGVVILMHGVRANRLSMVERARMFRAAGYSVLLFDFQAHGESPGKHITFGFLESRDARAAVDFVHREFPGQPVAVVGTSLGGAAAVLADPPLDLDALVLEAVYPTIEAATENRLRIRFGPLGPLLAPLLTAQLGPRLGIGREKLRPIDSVGAVRCPVFVISGLEDQHTTPDQTRALYARAPEPKRLWLVPGAAHVDPFGFAPEEYRRRVLDFLATSLSKPVTSSGASSPGPA